MSNKRKRSENISELSKLLNQPSKHADELDWRLEASGKFQSHDIAAPSSESLSDIVNNIATEKIGNKGPSWNQLYHSMDESAMVAISIAMGEFVSDLVHGELNNEPIITTAECSGVETGRIQMKSIENSNTNNNVQIRSSNFVRKRFLQRRMEDFLQMRYRENDSNASDSNQKIVLAEHCDDEEEG